MSTHAYHRQLTWGWSNESQSWDLLEDEIRPYYYDDYDEKWENDEVSQQNEYQYGVAFAQHGLVPIGHPSRHWPGPIDSTRRDAYFVGYMGWNPGMPSWEWQQYQHVWPDGPSRAMSNSEVMAFNATTQDIVGQATSLPTPDDEAKADRNKNIAIAAGVGLLATFTLALIVSAASHGSA